jgi:hypothetical protein
MTTNTETPAFAQGAIIFKEEDIVEGIIVAIEK